MRKLAVALAAALLAACEPKSRATLYTCDLSENPSFRRCTQLAPLTAEGIDANQASCTQNGGVWAQDVECPTANRVASCQYINGELDVWYAGADLAGAASACGSVGGEWRVY